MSHQRTLIFETLKGEPVARFMKSEVVTVDPDITIERLVEDYVYKYHYKMFPVAHGRELMGCVTTRDVKSGPREEWGDHTVREIFEKCDGNNSIGVNQDATEALQRMHKTGKSRLLVTENGNLAGVLSLENLLEFLSLKLDLEGKGVISRSIGGEGSRRHQL